MRLVPSSLLSFALLLSSAFLLRAGTTALAQTSGLSAQYTLVNPQSTLLAGARTSLSLTVTNTGTIPWGSTGSGAVQLDVYFTRAGTCPSTCAASASMQWFAFPTSVPAGGSTTLSLSVADPAAVGTYTLRFQVEETVPLAFGPPYDTPVTVATSLPLSGPLTISSDPFASTVGGQHSTEVEPDTFAYGNTLVSAFQVGRYTDGGSAGIGYATYVGGVWHNGLLPGLTVNTTPAGPYARASDPSVAYDTRHGVWLVSSLDLNASISGVAVGVNRSTDGQSWSSAVTIASASSAQNFDKDWIVCDNSSSSPYYGHCYAVWDDVNASDQLLFSTSTDGGLTWSTPITATGAPTGLGGQPVVQPNGTVVMPFSDAYEASIQALSSSDGGASWSAPVTVSTSNTALDPGGIRSGPLPSAEVDASGKVYVAWEDCRFTTACSANDIVISSSTNGTSWSSPLRVPIAAVGSGLDAFDPGLAVNPATSGATAQLALTYYFFPSVSCTSNCQLEVGFTSSSNGGSTWSAPSVVAGPMSLSWLPSTNQGLMVGDYQSTSFLGSTAISVFAAPAAPAGSTYNVPMEALVQPVSSVTTLVAAAAVSPPSQTFDRRIHTNTLSIR